MAKSLAAGTLINAACTFLSRILGLARDVATAAVFGAGPVMDAFNIGFRVPNLFRRLFGEGALSAAMIPVLSRYLHEKDRSSAWRLAGIVLSVGAVVLVGLTLIGEGLVWLLASAGGDPRDRLTLGLVAAMLPYAILICLVAQLSAILHTLRHFTFPALAPVVLNVCWLTAILAVAPAVAETPESRVYVLAGAILVAGVLQLAMQLAPLRRHGFRFQPSLDVSEPGFRRIVLTMAPMTLGLAITQINTLADSLIAYLFSSAGGAADTMNLFGWQVAYPMQTGAAACLYYGDRIYQFPLGVFGIALATAIYPLLAEHAARGQHDRIPTDLAKGLRLTFFIGIPASVGLVLLAHPIVLLVLRHGQFTAADAARTSRIVAMYCLGVWAYCANHVLARGFYAVGDTSTPVKVGAWVVVLNLLLNLSLIWPLGVSGLALATAISAAVRVAVLSGLLRRRIGALGAGAILASVGRHVLASLLMAGAILALFHFQPAASAEASVLARGVSVLLPVALGGAVYLLAAVLLGAREPRELFEPLLRRRRA